VSVIVVIVVVVALVAAGLLIVRPWLNSASEGPDPTVAVTTPSASATPWAGMRDVPTALTEGVPTTDAINIVGVWSGVAVFALQYADWALCVGEEYCLTHSILRGVDYLTGDVLWTIDHAPNAISATGNLAVHEAGRIAIFLQDAVDQTAYLLVISLLTGEVHSSRDDPIGLDDHPDGWGIAHTVLAYEGGIVVVAKQARGGSEADWSDTVTTTAYRDTNLAGAIWQIVGFTSSRDDLWWNTIDRLPGGLVKARMTDGRTTYVSIATGEVSGNPLEHSYGDSRLFVVQGKVIEATNRAESDGIAALAGWLAPGSTAPTWTYAPASGSSPWEIQELGCATAEVLVVQGATWEGSELVKYVFGIDLASGRQLWAMENGTNFIYGWSCTVMYVGDQHMVLMPGPDGVAVVNITTGERVATLTASGPKSVIEDMALFPCGERMVCLFGYTTDGPGLEIYDTEWGLGMPNEFYRVNVITYKFSQGQRSMEIGDIGLPLHPYAFPTADGLVVPYRDISDRTKYGFYIL
jgi:hypothetical protein